MKKIVLIFSLLIIFSLVSAETTLIDFETEGDGYTPSATEGSGYTDVFNRDNYNLGGNSTNKWCVEDLSLIDPYITIDRIDITGATNFTFDIDMIAHHYNDWDNNDELLITYSIDSGAYQNLMWVENIGATYNQTAALDTDFDGVGECDYVLPALTTGTSGCTADSDVFETFSTSPIALSGNTTLDITLQFNGLTSTDEGIYLDNITITTATGGNNPPDISDVSTDPAAPASTDAVDISADISDTDGTISSATCYWGTDGVSFPNSINMSTSRATYTTESSIQAQTGGTTVYYKIQAIDDEPDTTTTGAYSYTVPYDLSIYEIQGGTSASPYDGDEVITSGIVTAVYSYYFVIQDSASTWNGIWVDDNTAVTEGDDVTVRGYVDENASYGDTDNTMLTNVSVTINSSGNPLPSALVLTTGSVPSEEYEGVLVKVEEAGCTNENLGYGEWELNDGSGACRVNDLGYAYYPTLGMTYNVTGPLAYSYSDFKIEPRDSTDVVATGDTDPPSLVDVIAPNDSTVQVTFSEYVDETTSENPLYYSIADRIVSIESAVRNDPDSTQVTLTVSGMTEGDYTLIVINVEDINGNAMITDNMNFNYTAPPETGDVVINEIGEPYDMPSTWESSYIELYNTTEDSIDIGGWIVHSINNARATSSFTFPEGTYIAADGYIIATRDRDAFLSDYGTYVDAGIVPIASATTGTGVYIANNYLFSLETNVSTTLESTSPTVYWNSQVYERAYADSAADDDDNWYLTYQSDPVQGTPGHENSSPPEPTAYTIYELQSVDHSGEFVETSGIVTGVYSGTYTLQDGTGAYNGIWIDGTGVALGDSVTVEGTVDESSSKTVITADSETINSSGNTVPGPDVIASSQVNQEEYEGVLVRVESAVCTDPDLGYGEWEITTPDSTGCAVDDLGYAFTPDSLAVYTVTGPVNYTYGAFKIEPRDSLDVVSAGAPDAPTGITITHDGTNVTISWDVEGGVTYTIYSDTDPYGTYETVEESGNTSGTYTEALDTKKFYRVTANN